MLQGISSRVEFVESYTFIILRGIICLRYKFNLKKKPSEQQIIYDSLLINSSCAL